MAESIAAVKQIAIGAVKSSLNAIPYVGSA